MAPTPTKDASPAPPGHQAARRHFKIRAVKWPARLLALLCALALTFILVFLWTYRYRNDEYLARYIMSSTSQLRGRIEIGRVHWGLRAIVDLAMGTPTPITIDHYAVYDPRGQRVIYAPWASGKVELLPLVTGGNLVVHKLWAPAGSCIVAEQVGPHGKREIGLVAAFTPSRPSSKKRGPRIELLRFNFDDVDLKLSFADWSLDLKHIRTSGSFVYGGGDPSREGLIYSLKPTASEGRLTIRGFEVPLRNLVADRWEVTSDSPLDLQSSFSVEAAGARTQLRGKLTQIFSRDAGIDFTITSPEVQRILRRLVGESGAGPGRMIATIRGPMGRPTVRAQVFDVAIGRGALRAQGIKGEVVVDMAQGQLHTNGLEGALLGGRVATQLGMSLGTGDWSGRAQLRELDPGPFAPWLAGRLSGQLQLVGDLQPARVEARMNLVLARAAARGRDWLPRQLSIGGKVHLGTEIVDLADLVLDGEGNKLRARGSVHLLSRRVNLKLSVDAPHLAPWLTRRQLTAAAEAGSSELHVRGRYPDLHATGTVNLRRVGYRGVRLPQLAANVDLTGGVLRLDRVRSEGYGGKLNGEATIKLFEGKITHPVASPQLQARVRGEGLDLEALVGGRGSVRGKLSLQAEVAGPIEHLEGTATVRTPQLQLAGDRYDGAWASVGLLKDRLCIYEGHLPRARGGRLAAWGDVFFDRRLDLRVEASAFPLAGIPRVGQSPVPIASTISGKVDVTGTSGDPRFSGRLRLSETRVRGVGLGAGELRLTPGSDGVRIDGRLLGQLLRIDGYVLMKPQPRIHLSVDVRRLPAEKLLYELRQVGDIQGVVSGQVRLDADTTHGLSRAEARISTVQLSLRTRPFGARKAHVLTLSNRDELVATYDGKRLLARPTRLVTRVAGEAGQAEFTVGGWVSPAKVDLQLKGKAPVEILEFLLARRVKKLGGDVEADVRLAGPLGDPSLDGRLNLNYISILPARFDRPIEIAQGRVRLVPGRLRLEGLKIQVDSARMLASGEVELERLRPKTLNLALAGDVSLKLVQLFFPEQISNSAGTSYVEMKITGPVRDPQLAGRLLIKRAEVSPRGWGRTITLTKGEILFSNSLVRIERTLSGTYDEGLIRLGGEVRLDQWDLVDIYLKIGGSGIPHRAPKVYTAEVNLNLMLLGDSQRLSLQGDVELVDARYVRTFDVIRQAFFKPRTSEEETPVWKGSRLLEELQLKLQVQSTGQLGVKNNYADLLLSGALMVSGTLSTPRFSGQIRVEEGTFRIPFLRGDYTINRGDISFDPKRTVDEAEINITGETAFLDRNSVDYQIKLLLLGPLNRIAIQLSSSPALDQGQILALLAFGRTTDQLRSQLKGEGASAGTLAAGAADAQIKQLTSEILSQIIEEPLKKVTRLDLIRFEVGTESAQLKACKKLGRYVNLCGNYEQGLLGETRAEGWAELKLSDLLMLVGKWERLSTRLEAEGLESSRGRGELKIRWPLR